MQQRFIFGIPVLASSGWMIQMAMSQQQLLQLGTSAGGARAKAIIAWNESSGNIAIHAEKRYSSHFTILTVLIP